MHFFSGLKSKKLVVFVVLVLLLFIIFIVAIVFIVLLSFNTHTLILLLIFLIICRSFNTILTSVDLLIWPAILWCFNMGFPYLGRHLVPNLFWDIGNIMFLLFLISSIAIISISGATTIPARLIGPAVLLQLYSVVLPFP